MTAKEKRERKQRRSEYMRVFINGKEKWLKRPATIDGVSVHEFVLRNADPIWLHQMEMWELIDASPAHEAPSTPGQTAERSGVPNDQSEDDEIPF